MKDDKFIEHCEGLNDKLDKNDIAGFYFFLNNASGKGDKVGSLAACDLDSLPKVFQDIFMLVHCLNNKETSREAKKKVSKIFRLAISVMAIDLKDVIQQKKGEGNG